MNSLIIVGAGGFGLKRRPMPKTFPRRQTGLHAQGLSRRHKNSPGTKGLPVIPSSARPIYSLRTTPFTSSPPSACPKTAGCWPDVCRRAAPASPPFFFYPGRHVAATAQISDGSRARPSASVGPEDPVLACILSLMCTQPQAMSSLSATFASFRLTQVQHWFWPRWETAFSSGGRFRHGSRQDRQQRKNLCRINCLQ